MPRFPKLTGSLLPFALAFVLSAAPSFAAPAVGTRGGGGDDDGIEALTLRVNDAVAKPGGNIAVVVRTYAARPIRQGQVCFRPRRGAPPRIAAGLGQAAQRVAGQPFATLLGGLVFGARGDVTYRTTFGSDDAVVTFQSPSAAINEADGPIAVLYFKLSADLQPGEQFTLDVDLANSFLMDDQGRPIQIEVRPGTLDIDPAEGTFAAIAAGGRVDAGKTISVGLLTTQFLPLRRGQVAFRFDPSLLNGSPGVRINGSFGRATFTVNRATPGLVIVTFDSPDASLNAAKVGKLIELRLPTKRSLRKGARYTVRIDPNLTYFEPPSFEGELRGDLIPFTLRAGVIEIR